MSDAAALGCCRQVRQAAFIPAAIRERLDTFHDVRVERYWQLLAILHDGPPFPAIAAACEWFIQALRARE